jgi:hypothetical protein
VRPSQGMTDQIWLIVVGSFAIVFVSSALALFWASFLNLQGVQVLLTVVTTIGGILAGFVSGRSRASNTTQSGH